jgi:alpha-galactosidase
MDQILARAEAAGDSGSGATTTAATVTEATVTAHADGVHWTISTGTISKSLTWQPERGLFLAQLADRTHGFTWQPALDAAPHAGGEFTLTWREVTLSGRQAVTLRGVRASTEQLPGDAAGPGDSREPGAAHGRAPNSVTLAFDLGLSAPNPDDGHAPDVTLDVTLHYRAHAATGVIEQWLTVTPQAAGTLHHATPLTLSLHDLRTPTVHWVRGIQNHGHYTPAEGLYPAYRLVHVPLTAETGVVLESGLRSTWHELPWLALDSSPDAGHGATGGPGIFGGLLYSGRWSAQARAYPQGAGVELALATTGYAVPLAAGAAWQSPAGFLGAYHGDLDDAAHVHHTYLRAAVLPPTPDDFPWVQYNSWFAHLVDIDESILRPEVDRAAELGAEVFVIDAGWWEPSRRTSDNFTTGLGLWRESAEKFPGGLRAFADYVRSRGMHFGIWVEPERVDLRRPGTWRDRWLVRHHDAIVSPPWPPDTVSGWLCFGHPEVQAWAIEWIGELVAGLGADWLKWDSNWWGVCTCADHGHSTADGEYHQVQGVHNVLRELRQRFPHLRIENCAGGGVRTDFAMLAQSHVTWLHDSSTPSRRVRFHLEGAAYVIPPHLSNTFIVDADDEPLTDPNTPRAELDAIARSRMLGALGVSARLPAWSSPAFAAVQAAIVQYKQLRPLLRRGRVYHLLPQPNLPCPDLALHGQWQAFALLAASGATGLQGAVWAFRPTDAELAQSGPTADASLQTRRIPLRGLDATVTYTVRDLDTGHTITAKGADLQERGLLIDLAARPSALFLLQR